MNLIEDLEWRYACKGMNGRKVPQKIIERILKAISLAPSSLGLQPYKILVVENEELREQIFEKACPQQPIKGSSHLLVFASYTQISEMDLDDYMKLIEIKRNPGDEWCNNYRKRISFFLDKNKNIMESWLTHQTYIALGIACVAAANEKVDSVPIEGFDKEELNAILDLPKQHLSASILLPLGYRDPEKDWMNNQPKIRKEDKDLFEILK